MLLIFLIFILNGGLKYEEIATLFYQLITRTNVIEFGMIPHPDFPYFRGFRLMVFVMILDLWNTLLAC